jgi:ubiquinone/menaquinone biosynthesis C-methylase UbiE
MKASIADRVHFKLMSLVHETLYGLFKDPHKALNAAGIRPGQKVLEVGCGPGFFTIPAAKMVGPKGSVCALDMSPSAIERVQQKIEEAGATNIETLLSDAARTSLPDESFDLVFLFGLDHAKGNMRGIMTEMHRLLKPGGILSIEGRLQVSNQLFKRVERQGKISQFRKDG